MVQKNGRIIPDGQLVAADFQYSSDNNSEWLSVDELKKLVLELEYIH